MRHGEAENQVSAVFSGSPSNRDRYGLTSRGAEQVRRGAEKLRDELLASGRKVRILHSDFRRCGEASSVAAEVLGPLVLDINAHPALRERDPGSLEGVSYRKIARRESYAHDLVADGVAMSKSLVRRIFELLHGPRIFERTTRKLLGIEPCLSVQERATALVRQLHEAPRTESVTYLLISHEFTIAILLNALLNRPPALFWENRHIPNGAPLTLSRATAALHFYGGLHHPLRHQAA